MRYAVLVAVVAIVGCAPQPPKIVKALPAPTFEPWAPQEFVVSVQDWDRVATKIADGLQANGLLRLPPAANGSAIAGMVIFDQAIVGSQAAGHAFSATYDRSSIFLRQVNDALEHEVVRRGGAAANMHVDLAVSIVPWGSRLATQLYTPRLEGIWQAKVQVGNAVMSFREPFYILASDAALYVQLPALPPTPDQELAATARALRYSTR